jgi:surfactin family lipopeptide synthetase A
MVQHRNLINYLYAFAKEFKWTRDDTIVQQASYAFDAFAEEIYPVLLTGGKIALPGKSEITDVDLLAEFILRHRVNIIDCSPLLLNELNKRPPLPGIHTYISGGDELREEYITNLLKTGTVYNTYGPTETTICASYFNCSRHRQDKDKTASIPIGKPILNYKIYILNKENMLQPVGIPGELAVSGEGTARGYLNNVELTAERFLPVFYRSHRSDMSYSSKKFYKTGDLARWRPDGNIEFLGRIDNQVKIRGYRIELGEIESQLLKHEDIKEVVAVLKERDRQNKYISAYFVANREKTLREVRQFLSSVLPDYMIPAHFVQLDRMPLTASGKIDRALLPEPGDNMLETGVEYAAPENETEKKLAGIWQEILQIGDSAGIGVLDDFFELGGDSLAANQVIARIRESLHVDISLKIFFEKPFIRALSREVDRSKKKVSVIEKAPRHGKIPLSFAQERLWFLQKLDNENLSYHVPRVIRFYGELSIILVERTVTEIIRRHEILRTLFPTVDGQPVQRILEPFDFRLPIIDFSGLSAEEQQDRVSQWIQQEGQREFDLEQGTLLRITLLKLKEKEHILVLTEHHLIHDGWTQGVLLREFTTIFSAYTRDKPSPLPELPIQYADYAIWQRNLLQGEVLENHLDYWRKKLAGSPPVLELPADRPRPPAISGKGGLKELWLSEPLSNELRRFSKDRGVTLFITMLAVFKAFLYRYTGIRDLCVGTGMANRRYKELEGMLGMVINTLALRTEFSGEMSFEELLNRVKTTCLEGYEHEDTPFGKVVEMIQPERSLSYTPVFQVLFSFMDIPAVEFVLPGLEIRAEMPHNRSAKFDLNIIVVPPLEFQEEEHRGEILMEWEYSTDIFDDETIDRMSAHYLSLLENAVRVPGEKISRLHLLDHEEIHRLLYRWNDTTTPYPHRQTIHQLFAEQAGAAPDKVAVVGKQANREVSVTYSRLRQASCRLASRLREKGVQPDTVVGLMTDRSLEMPVGILAILNAGGAYLPIDIDYPQERVKYMIKDSNVELLLIQSSSIEPGDFYNDRQVVELDEFLLEGEECEAAGNPIITGNANPGNLAYIMYTSGSTGGPKGVMVQHRNVVRLVKGVDYVELNTGTRILQTGAPVFDAATLLCVGGDGVSRGYLNNPELTAEKFDHDLWDYRDYHDKKLLRGVQGGSFLEKRPPGRRRQKLYKTGDLARWRPDGNIEFGPPRRIARENRPHMVGNTQNRK